ncbi:TfoX/Sxy family protein [Methanobrevibacter sp. TMH8]|uniref:TfoX/Sxy family protein n=1 Tax=Methanobrevibacter sp. TMH8 TaxID=2848611 RepID=UPI001CC9F555|nr:TfoX/Sxy family protein [Methanobrevibacter sp. TMH8]MBZ9571711.1 TfoX/Sxy family protein [Methanobrevibacter sp. TMH8]
MGAISTDILSRVWNDYMGELSKLPNIGKVLESQLNKIGIKTAKDLEECGSHEAWLAIKENDPSACYNRLCGIEGAIQGIRWHDLSDTDKKSLKDFYSLHK